MVVPHRGTFQQASLLVSVEEPIRNVHSQGPFPIGLMIGRVALLWVNGKVDTIIA